MPFQKRPGVFSPRLITVFLALAVAGCIETTPETSDPSAQQNRVSPDQNCATPSHGAPPQCGASPVSCDDDTSREGGRSYPVMLTSASGETIAFQVLEPMGGIDCKQGHPLVLHGHGFGGSRSTEGFENYREAGFAVISIDQRGFGESTGTVRVMDPEFEGHDLIQILGWAEENLDYLQYRQEPDLPRELNPNLVAGAIGGSYGGGFQLLLHGQDPLLCGVN